MPGRSARKKTRKEDDDHPEGSQTPSSKPLSTKGMNDNVENVEEGETSSSNRPKDKKRGVSRELRRKNREEIRGRNMGLGLSISTQPTVNKNKIVFDDNLQDATEEPISSRNPKKAEKDHTENSDADDDDDDAVEEVKSNVARNVALEQRAQERETAKVQKLQKRTKKRKKTEKDVDKGALNTSPETIENETLNETVEMNENEDGFGEEFFAQVDSEMATRRQQKKAAKDREEEPKGRHTTFISPDEQPTAIKAHHDIELVVLGDDDAGNEAQLRITEANMGTRPSAASHLFARGRLLNGKGLAIKKGSNKKKQDDPGWKRSKKVTVVATDRARINRKNGRGSAAGQFVVKA